MRSDTGLYLVATVVLLLGLGSRLSDGQSFQAVSRWTDTMASRVAATLIDTPLLAMSGANVGKRAQLATFIAQERTACVNAKIAREQARMARIQAQINRRLATKSLCLEAPVRQTRWQ